MCTYIYELKETIIYFLSKATLSIEINKVASSDATYFYHHRFFSLLDALSVYIFNCLFCY